jgi:V8-like Glu-specific endopeptidase
VTAFSAYLSEERVGSIIDAWVGSGMDYLDSRSMLLSRDGGFRNTLVRTSVPTVQLTLDLARLNATERLISGEVPLQTWLTAALRLFRSSTASAVFEQALEDVTRLSSGAPAVAPPTEREQKEVIVNEDDMVTYAFVERALSTAKSVGKMLVPRYENGAAVTDNGAPVLYFGTGWLIARTLLITNHHVVNARRDGEPAAPPNDLALQCSAATVRFDYDSEAAVGTTYTAAKLEAANPSLDYALLRVPDSSRTALRTSGTRLDRAEGAAVPVNIIQHPGGNAKKYAIRNNLVSSSLEQDLRYFTDTNSGSSGSPVFDDDWLVVALHRGATRASGVKFQGRKIPWLNVGTHLSVILSDLATRTPALAAEIAAAGEQQHTNGG